MTDFPSRTDAPVAGVGDDEIRRLMAADHPEPHSILGAHPWAGNGTSGVVIRATYPDAVAVQCLLPDGRRVPLVEAGSSGLFVGRVPEARLPLRYRLRYEFSSGASWETEDAYRFLPTLGDLDLHFFNEGTHRRLWKCLGAHLRSLDGVSGTAFAVWAPNARRVSVVGEFCDWDGRRFPMRQMGSSGVFELFIPEMTVGALYKYEIKTQQGDLRLKSDPFAFSCELPPGSASRVYASTYVWNDQPWMEQRRAKHCVEEPMAVYEVHLGSWAHVPEDHDRSLTYREIAPRLVAHMKRFGLTHVELLPVAEHPFGGSWGYQVTGYYAPTARYGTPDDFRFLVDTCHQNGIAVLLDWVPGHFPKDDFALRLFDGTALYEHEDPREGEHPDWGTLIFNYGRREVSNFLLANALFWFEEFHIDGLRVDAVASMLYRDYSRKEGEWLPNHYGGRENLEATDFIRATNQAVAEEHPGGLMIAEESTAWPGVTRPVVEGGLGFSFKWNMGWMHDTLVYFSKDPVHRKFHQNDLTFAMLYEYSERFIMPLSHDEVVHGKGSLLSKMPGDLWQKMATMRLLLAYQYTRPGKKLLFMGTELAPYDEWHYGRSLDWHLASDSWRVGLSEFLQELGRVYLQSPCLWRNDHDPGGFQWIDCRDCDNSVLAYERRSGEDRLVVVLNLTPVPRPFYRVGVPSPGRFTTVLCSDERRFGGSEMPTVAFVDTEPLAFHGFDQSIGVTLPPLGAWLLRPLTTL